MRSPPGGIIRPANKVVQGDIEVVGKGDEDIKGRFATPTLIVLDPDLAQADGSGKLFLREVVCATDFN